MSRQLVGSKSVYRIFWSPRDRCHHHGKKIPLFSKLSFKTLLHTLSVCFLAGPLSKRLDLKQPSALSLNTAAHSIYVMISTSARNPPSSAVYFNVAFNIHSTKSLSQSSVCLSCVMRLSFSLAYRDPLHLTSVI